MHIPLQKDERMSVIQALNHPDAIAMGLILKEAGIGRPELKRFSTPILDMRLAIIEKICTNNPFPSTRISSLSTRTPLGTSSIYEKSFSSLKDLVERNDPEVLAELISSSLK